MLKLQRRRFLIHAAGLSGVAASGAIAALLRAADPTIQPTSRNADDLPPENENADQPPARAGEMPALRVAARVSRALGAEVKITALHRDESVARRAIDDAFAELESVERVISIYRPESQLSQLNRCGVLDRPHPYLVEVLRFASELSRRSTGAFDVTVQPLWALLHETSKAARSPKESEIDEARRRVDWTRVAVSDRRIELRGDGTAITLNGIAQGFAADRAAAALRARGVEHALINTGELNALAPRPGESGWKIGIQHPRRDDAYISLARLAGRSLATSGDYASKFTPDYRWHHLFDPRTGRSPSELMSVSVAARTAIEADALSTAAFVLGAEEGGKLVRETPDADALFVLRSGRTLATPDFPFDRS